ncbi:fibronectin type III-like domain-contianing protein [Draconibacterium orientale]|uniref:fibronectin type III-like domain-contianing protein n=1 Tax=Draconibacterium orientale TaxID=1168034 RepID=UPI0029C0B525|nr:fibronectin type III-like domain-contianing protein [Draconibacterium orientale]
MYVHDKGSSLTRPIIELKDFKRVSIKAGETQKVKFQIDADKLKFFNIDMKEVVEPGEFEIMVGPNSQDTEVVTF